MDAPAPPPRPTDGPSSPGEVRALLVAELRRRRKGYGPEDAAEDAAALLPWRTPRQWRELIADPLGDPAGVDALRRVLAFLIATGTRPAEPPDG